MIINKKLLRSIVSIGLLGTAMTSFSGTAQDSVSSYIFQGNSVSPWTLSVGNGLNWYIPVKEQKAKTKRKNLTVSPEDKDAEGDALNLNWRGRKVKNQWGGNALYDTSFSIGKHSVDISSVQQQAALTLELKINKAPNEPVSLNVTCNNDNNNCSSKYPIKKVLRNLPKDKWITLPIPLACFAKTSKGGDFDFSKLTGMSIATQGKLNIDVANIVLTALPAGKTGCQ